MATNHQNLIPDFATLSKKKGVRYGNGDLAELVEWACRTYGWTYRYAAREIPAVHVALLYRCYAQSAGGVKSGTMMEDELWANEGSALCP